MQDIEAAAAAVALQRVGGIRDKLQLLQHELRDDERTVEKSRLADVRDSAVDDHTRIENTVALLRSGVAEQAYEPLRLKPFAFARSHDDSEVRKHQEDETVEEYDPIVGRVGPEERRPNRLRESQSDRPADQRAKQIGDLRRSQPCLDKDDEGAECCADRDVRQREWIKGPRENRGPGNCCDEADASQDVPRHGL